MASPVSVEVTLRSSDNARVYARAVGDSTKPGMVLAHGVGLSSIVFDGILSDLRLLKSYYLVAYDARGHGRSEMPMTIEDYSSKLFADDFATVCKHFGLRSPIFVGWSLGGEFLVLFEPYSTLQLLTASILCDICSHLGKDAISKAVYIAPLPYIGPPIQAIATPLALSLLHGLLSIDTVQSYRESRINFIDEIFNRSKTLPASMRWSLIGNMIQQAGEVTQLVLSRSQDPSGLWKAGKSGLPLLVVLAEDDQQCTNEVIVNIMKPHFVNMNTVIIPNASHAFFIERQRELVDALLNFAR